MKIKIYKKIIALFLILSFSLSCTNAVYAKYSSVNLNNIDNTVNPGDDFYKYANGKWIKNNSVNDTDIINNSFKELEDKTTARIKNIVRGLAKNKDVKTGSPEQKIRDFYISGMNTSKINKDGLSTISNQLKLIYNIKNKDELLKTMAYFQSYGFTPLFYLCSFPDLKNNKSYIATLEQIELPLRDKELYLNNDKKSKDIKIDYKNHIYDVFRLLGYSTEDANEAAHQVIYIESELAKHVMSAEEERNLTKTYNKYSIDGLDDKYKNLDMKKYLRYINYGYINDIVVRQEDYMKNVNDMLNNIDVDNWKNYLVWRFIYEASPFLDDNFKKTNFDFFQRKLLNINKMKNRETDVIDNINSMADQLLGQLYVKKYFSNEDKKRVKSMVINLKKSFKNRIENVTWMEEKTKKQAISKLENMKIDKIGYPDKWRDYSKLKITKDSYFQNVLNICSFNFNFGDLGLSKAGKKVKPGDWGISPQTVNAYYDPSKNEVVFPAAILQPPFFNPNGSEAENYGGIGMVIGHEMTHGFDDQGRNFDAEGNFKNWWSENDIKEFREKCNSISDEYSKFEVLPHTYINGNLTLGENIADLGGLLISLDAYKHKYKFQYKTKDKDGFTGAQRFFLSYAQLWKCTIREEALRLMIKKDPHSPAKYRVNGTVYNIDEFYKAFPSIDESGKKYKEKKYRVSIW